LSQQNLILAENVTKWFDLRSSFTERLFGSGERYVKAVDDISFYIKKGETYGLVGESGCGKTTTGRLLMNSIPLTSGRILFEDLDLTTIKTKEQRKTLTSKMQMIFQDPYEYLSPWLNIERTLAEPIRIHKLASSADEEHDMIIKIMETVGLTPTEMILPKMGYELSGGQRQRVVVARALLLNPKFLVADEPVSMLDVSIRVGILNLLKDLQKDFDLTQLFITHDIAVSRYMCDRIGVMYLGKLVETGPTETIVKEPLHPYTKALITAVPVPDPKIQAGEVPIKGRIPGSNTDLPPGCRFHPRCPSATEQCEKEIPVQTKVGSDHYVTCWKYS